MKGCSYYTYWRYVTNLSDSWVKKHRFMFKTSYTFYA